MSAAEALLRDVEEKRKRDLSKLESDYAEKKEEIKRPIQSQLQSISELARTQSTELSQREETRIAGAGKLQAKKILFDATEKMLENNLADLKEAFSEYSRSQNYDVLLSNMVRYASKRLGPGIKAISRKEDVEKLEEAGVTIISSDLNSIGGFKAESSDGSLELDMTFEEILRNHQDQIRAIIQSA